MFLHSIALGQPLLRKPRKLKTFFMCPQVLVEGLTQGNVRRMFMMIKRNKVRMSPCKAILLKRKGKKNNQMNLSVLFLCRFTEA